jgi:hypothetical protein
MERYRVSNYRYIGSHRTADYHGRWSLVTVLGRIATTVVIGMTLLRG